MLNANLHGARHKVAKQQSQNKKLFSGIAMVGWTALSGTDPGGPEVTQSRNSANNENGIFLKQRIEGLQKSHHLAWIW